MSQTLDIVHDHILICRLLSLYGNQLSAKLRQYMNLYFDEDMSITEIAEYFSVSRQAVHNSLSKGCEQLRRMEADLKLLYMHNHLQATVSEVENLLSQGEVDDSLQLLRDLVYEYEIN